MVIQVFKSVAHSWLQRLKPYRKVVLIPYPGNRKQLTSEAVILLSYPRSGNTWARHLIADLVQQSLGFETKTILPIKFWKVVPSIYTQSLAKLAADPVWTNCRLVKSHEHRDLASRRVIYIVRRPEDVLCSWYRFNCNHETINAADVSLDKFCRDQLTEWIEHIQAAIQYHEANPEKMIWVCYELLHNDPHASLTSIARFLNLGNVDINKAIRNHTFKARKKVATQEEAVFATCKGKIGSGKQELQRETRQFLQKQAQSLYDKAYSLSMSSACQMIENSKL